MDVWLSQNPTCPFCKQTVEPPAHRGRSKSSSSSANGASRTPGLGGGRRRLSSRNLRGWLRFHALDNAAAAAAPYSPSPGAGTDSTSGGGGVAPAHGPPAVTGANVRNRDAVVSDTGVGLEIGSFRGGGGGGGSGEVSPGRVGLRAGDAAVAPNAGVAMSWTATSAGPGWSVPRDEHDSGANSAAAAETPATAGGGGAGGNAAFLDSLRLAFPGGAGGGIGVTASTRIPSTAAAVGASLPSGALADRADGAGTMRGSVRVADAAGGGVDSVSDAFAATLGDGECTAAAGGGAAPRTSLLQTSRFPLPAFVDQPAQPLLHGEDDGRGVPNFAYPDPFAGASAPSTSEDGGGLGASGVSTSGGAGAGPGEEEQKVNGDGQRQPSELGIGQ